MTKLPTTNLGRTGIPVTRLGYGAAHRKPINNAQRKQILTSVITSGINFVDTAGCYGRDKNNSESLIGRYISNVQNDYTIATKCGCQDTENRWTEKNIFTDVYTSLERMKIQQIPILQLHGPSVKKCEDNQVVATLQKLQSEGLVKWIGISTSLPDLETFFNWDVFDVFQLPYSLLNRKHHTWITKLSEKGHGIIVNNGIAQGEPHIGTGETSMWEKFNQAHLNDLLAVNEDPTQFALRFAFTHPYIDTNIVGTTNVNHLEKNIQTILLGKLEQDIYKEANQRLDNLETNPTKT